MSAFDLGRPIGQQTSNPREGTEAGEHGSGVGLSGGHGTANASNTQSGQFAQQGQGQDSFAAGLGGAHASGGIPSGHNNSGSNHPIADKFTSSSSGFTGSSSGGGLTSSSGRSAGDKLDNSLDQYSGNQDHSSHSHGHSGVGAGLGAGAAAGLAGGAAAGHHHHHDNNQQQHGLTGGNAPRGDAVSGAYAGGGVSDALTGESHAQRTGAGVGPLGENATAGSTGGSAALGSGQTGTGVGPSGGAGGHYDSSAPHGHHGAGAAGGALAGAGAAGVGAGALSQDSNDRSNTTGNNTNTDSSANKGTGQGHFGTVKEDDFNRGAPVSDPKDLDSGGRHGLVFQESTGKYVHRHELEEKR